MVKSLPSYKWNIHFKKKNQGNKKSKPHRPLLPEKSEPNCLLLLDDDLDRPRVLPDHQVRTILYWFDVVSVDVPSHAVQLVDLREGEPGLVVGCVQVLHFVSRRFDHLDVLVGQGGQIPWEQQTNILTVYAENDNLKEQFTLFVIKLKLWYCDI